MTEEKKGQWSELLPPPPRLRPHGELHPVTEFSFDDHPEPSWTEQYDQWERVESTPIKDEPILTDELAGEAESVALEHEEVSEFIGDRYVVIGTSLERKLREDGEPTLLVVAYDYDDDRTIEVTLEYDDGELEVMGVEQASYQPAPTGEELERSIQLAEEDEWLSEQLTREFEACTMLVTSTDLDDPRRAHRLFDVRFRQPNKQLPRYMALVDLSEDSVVEAGTVGDPDDGCGGHGRTEDPNHG